MSNINKLKINNQPFDIFNANNFQAGTNIGIAEFDNGDIEISTLTQGVEYIVGTQQSSTNVWTGTSLDMQCLNSTLYVGKVIIYHLPYNGNTSPATLNLTLADNSTTGDVNVKYLSGTNVTNEFSAGYDIFMIYDGTQWKTSASGTAKRSLSIPFAKVDSTSIATAYTATVPGITELVDGTCVMLENGVVTSAAGFTLNINGLGAKPVFNNLTAATRDTTIFNVNYTMLFVYDSNRVVDSITGAWCCYRGYDANTNTIGYQLRSNSYSKAMTDITYRYRLLFSSADNSKWVPANTSTSTNATSSRAVCQTPINPFGEIVYYGTTASVAAGSRPSATNLWQQYTLSLGYSFNRTGAALELTSWKPVYVKCAPQANGSAIMDADTPYVQDLPTTEDGKIYIFLGVAYSTTAIELLMNHPVFYYKDGAIRQWSNAAETDFIVDFVYDEDEGDYVCSKTYSEITAALAANRKVVGVAKYNNAIQGIYSNVYTTGNSVYFVQLDEGEGSSPEIFSFILSNADELTTSTHRLLRDTDGVIRGANNIWCSITIGSNDAVTVSNNPFTDFDSYIFGNEQSVILKASVTYNSASYSHDILMHAKYTGTGVANRKYIGITPLEYTNNKYLYLEFTSTTASGKMVEFYSKPSTGIPSTDLASAVQTSLGKADTSLQPDVANDIAQGSITSSTGQGFDFIVDSDDNVLQDVLDAKASISAVNAKQDTLVSGTNIKTVNNTSLLGSGNVSVGTITGITMNGSSKGTSGVVDLGTVLTAHQDISGKADINSPALTGTPTAPTAVAGTNTTQIATTAFVQTVINALPEPMIFKGSLGTGGTITTLPAASSDNEGFTYKVITAGTYASQAAKIGDTFISDGTNWILIPSGDEPSGTVTSITLNATAPLTINDSSAITTSGTRTLGITMDSTPTANSSNPVTSGALKTALDAKANDSNVVHKGTPSSSQAEPIYGVKTFESELHAYGGIDVYQGEITSTAAQDFSYITTNGGDTLQEALDANKIPIIDLTT